MSSVPVTAETLPLRYHSTRDPEARVLFSQALLQGLAPDGGLYVPTCWPKLSPREFTGVSRLADFAGKLLTPFLGDDPLLGELQPIVTEAFNFPAPLIELEADGALSVLELFHGPTAAFKDFGARFLAAGFARLRATATTPLLILVATSGDTGGAVAAAFHRRPGVRVGVLFPKGLVSPIQQRQLTCWGDNVQSCAVRGTFDDCQKLVKQAFLDESWRGEVQLSSANSINLGRLLPQAVYYAASSLQVWQRYGEPASYVIPSGNLGNALACIWARQVGLPIDRIVLAHNANRTVPEFLQSGSWQPRASIATLASAMDVGEPSNMERLRSLFPQLSALRTAVTADSVDDEHIRTRIRRGFDEYGQIWCPHTATGAEVFARLRARGVIRNGHWILVATAHPAKFAEIVEPLIARPVQVPESLAALLARQTQCIEIEPQLSALRSALRGRE
ncbi:MAG: threonine synthase [Sinobacteraceae bacterium]|nr:threonine synthase [Nevskiaceae bacterium]MBV8854423.1 threonine synthase [Nevskiaceae bacterium]